MFVIPDDLPIALTPFTFLLGNWRGSGVVSYPMPAADKSDAEVKPEEIEFLQTISFTPLQTGQLSYEAATTTLAGEPITSEKGFWMISKPADAADAGPGLLPKTGQGAILERSDLEIWRNADGGYDIEAIMIRADGVAELYFGQIKGARIDMGTDAVLRSPNARDYSAGHRMLGLVEGALLWAWDMSALGQPLKSHASARLERIDV